MFSDRFEGPGASRVSVQPRGHESGVPDGELTA